LLHSMTSCLQKNLKCFKIQTALLALFRIMQNNNNTIITNKNVSINHSEASAFNIIVGYLVDSLNFQAFIVLAVLELRFSLLTNNKTDVCTVCIWNSSYNLIPWFQVQGFVVMFLHMGQGFPHQLPVLENVILHPHVRRVTCDDVTISRALLLYKIAFILLGSGRKQ